MTATISLELKGKGKPALKLELSAPDPVVAIEMAYKAYTYYNGSSEALEDKAPMPNPGGKETPAASLGRGRQKQALHESGQDALRWLERLRLVVPDMNEQPAFDIVKNWGYADPIAIMSLKDLQEVARKARETVVFYSQGAGHEDASAFLSLAQTLDAATDLAGLEKGKDEFKGWKKLSANPALFNEAKRYYEERKRLLESLELV